MYYRFALRSGLLLSILLSLAVSAHAAPLLLRTPSLSPTQVAFTYAGNIWVVNRDGSHPHRLTSGGHDGEAVFSPDGSQVAFVGDYDGFRAVYVVPTAGGAPRRLTFHPADLGLDFLPDAIGWMPDGKHLFFNSRRAVSGYYGYSSFPLASQLYTVSATGGPATKVPLSRAVQASFSPDGSRVAYVPTFRRQPEWKGYRGGETTPIWIVNLADSRIEARIPRDNSNDFNPMWVNDTIYFLSDRDGPVTLFAYDLKEGRVTNVLRNEGLDIKSAAACRDGIVYEQFGSLHLLNVATRNNRLLNIRPHTDLPDTRPHLEPVLASQASYADISPDGASAVFGVRGEIVSISVADGASRNLTDTPGFVERDPAYAPDGRSVAYFSDESGEYALHIRDLYERQAPRKIKLSDLPGFYYSPTWSPDSRKIAYTDQRLNYWYLDLQRPKPVRVDVDPYVDPANVQQLAWSADSRWLAYTRLLPNHLHAVFLYSLEVAKSYQITDGQSDVLHVAFDKDGRHLYFTASTDIGPAAGWGDLSSVNRPVTRRVYGVVLGQDPAAISESLFALPIPAGNYYDLIAGKSGTLFLIEGPPVDPFIGSQPLVTTVHALDLKTYKIQKVLDGVVSFVRFMKCATSLHLSYDGDKMLYFADGRWYVASTSQAATEHKALGFDGVTLHVEPRLEWKHMFEQVWRDEQQFFYDPGLHGLDLRTIRQKYAPYLDGIASRDDLNYLLREMLGNLAVGHLTVAGADDPRQKKSDIGLLGADYATEGGRYRFDRIYRGDPWDAQKHAPLTQSDVRAGEFLLAIDGHEIHSDVDIYSYFADTVGKQVVLRVSATPDGAHSREVVVVPTDDERPLRYYAWVEDNRRHVDELSGGRIGYVHLADTYQLGYSSFNRSYFAQVGKDAVVIDARYNSGGDSPDYLIDAMRRPLMNYQHLRYGGDISEPQEAVFGPKVMLINEMSGSGGDNLAWAFRKAGIGPLIGERTWGGLVGHYTDPDDLLDGGSVTTPDLAFYNLAGSWDIENHGVAPDYVVEDAPDAQRAGHDPQLEKAVEVALKLLTTNPPTKPTHPPFPNLKH